MVARNSDGERVEATRRLPRADYTCPVCHEAVVLKPGRIVVPHFAHQANLDCVASGESPRHLAAKRILADKFRAAGYEAALEESYPAASRRVDVAVTVPGSEVRYAVEVQDSAITTQEMIRRTAADMRGPGRFLFTYWIWTGERADQLLTAPQGCEVRVTADVLHGVFGDSEACCLDVEKQELWAVRLDKVVRPDREYPDKTYPGAQLKTIHRIQRRRIGFALFGDPNPTPESKPQTRERQLVLGEEDVIKLLEEIRGSSLLDDHDDPIFRSEIIGQLTTLAGIAFGVPRTYMLQLWVTNALRFAGVRDIENRLEVRQTCERLHLDGGKIREPNMNFCPGLVPKEY